MTSGAQPAAGVAGKTLPAEVPRPRWLAELGTLPGELYQRSGAVRFAITANEFEGLLGEVVAKYLPGGAATAEVRELLTGLKVEDLALARACAAGNETAWEAFLLRFREKLYDAARAITRDDTMGRELADSLYGDLYGATTREGRRVSKLASYLGRGSLEGWLRTVLAQEYVNRYRSRRRLVSLEEKEEAGVQFAVAASDPAPPVEPRLDAATDEALAALGSEERFVLAAYFLDGRTLAEIARMLHVHESTISRKVEKITSTLRKRIRDGLVTRGMSRRQAEEALEADVRDLQVNVRARLAQEPGSPPFPEKSGGAGGKEPA
jgi:RNA polymerase sigma-70 factor (ECF subfamily)